MKRKKEKKRECFAYILMTFTTAEFEDFGIIAHKRDSWNNLR